MNDLKQITYFLSKKKNRTGLIAGLIALILYLIFANLQTKLPNNSNQITPTAQDSSGLYQVVKVIDGDTISVDIDGTTTTLRLIGINTPETVDPRKPVECFGIEASNHAKELLTSKQVRLESDPTQDERDKYDRLLRYVYLEDSTFYNEQMIKDGYAYEYTYETPYQFQTQFKAAATYARNNKLGLWSHETCGANVPTTLPSAPPTDPNPCDCTKNLYNCGDFASHNDAQACFESCGGVQNDIHALDPNHDGIACESLKK